MADTLHSVAGQLGTSTADIIDAVPSSTTETAIGILISNVNASSSDVTVDLSITKSGGYIKKYFKRCFTTIRHNYTNR